MLDIKSTVSTKEVEKMLGDLKHKMPSAIARGLTETAKDVRLKVQSDLPRYIDRPTPWTKRSVIFFPAEKNDLRAAVAFKSESGRIARHQMGIGAVTAATSMRMQIFGGKRPLKASEKTLLRAGITRSSRPYLIPGPGAKLDRYGNVPGSFMNKVLYQGVARGSASYGYARPMSASASRRAQKKYFVKVLFGEPQGIFERMAGRQIRPVFFFSATAQYRERFPFYSLARRHSNAIIDQKVSDSINVILNKYGRS